MTTVNKEEPNATLVERLDLNQGRNRLAGLWVRIWKPPSGRFLSQPCEEETSMNDTSKVPVKTEKSATPTSTPWHPFEAFRQEVDRLFEDFGRSFPPFGFGRRFELSPYWSSSADLSPAVDVVDKGTSCRSPRNCPVLTRRMSKSRRPITS